MACGGTSAEREVSLDSGPQRARGLACARRRRASGRRHPGPARRLARRPLRARVQHPARARRRGRHAAGRARRLARALYRQRHPRLGAGHGQGPHQAGLAGDRPADAALRRLSPRRGPRRGDRDDRLPGYRQALARRLERRHHPRVFGRGSAGRDRTGHALRRRTADRAADRRRRADRRHPRPRSAAVDPHRAEGRVLRLPRQVRRRRHPVPVSRPRWRSRGVDPRAGRGRVRRGRLFGLGTRRRHARRQRRQFPARGQHDARHDQPLAGAEGGTRSRHRFREPVLEDPRRPRSGGTPREGSVAAEVAGLGHRPEPGRAADRRRAEWLVRLAALAGAQDRTARRVCARQRRTDPGHGRDASGQGLLRRATGRRAEGGRRAALGRARRSAQAVARHLAPDRLRAPAVCALGREAPDQPQRRDVRGAGRGNDAGTAATVRPR